MIISSILSGIENLITNGYDRGKFIIYKADATLSSTKSQLESNQLLAFDGFLRLGYANNVQIPQQALENRGFTQDSLIDNPFILNLSAVISQQISSASDLENDLEGDIVKILEYMGKSDQLVTIFRRVPLFSAYINMHLDSWHNEQTPDNTALISHMTFREIRTAYQPNATQLTTSDGLNLSNNFSSTNSSNPANASTIDNGIINTMNPTGDVSNLQPSTGVVLN